MSRMPQVINSLTTRHLPNLRLSASRIFIAEGLLTGTSRYWAGHLS